MVTGSLFKGSILDYNPYDYRYEIVKAEIKRRKRKEKYQLAKLTGDEIGRHAPLSRG